MPRGFTNVRYHRDREGLLESDEIRSPAAVPGLDVPAFSNDETAARFYLSRALAGEGLEGIETESPEVAPDFQLKEGREQPLTNTHTVRFQQTLSSVPIFGADAVVELDRSRELVYLNVERAEGTEAVSPMPTMGPAEALARIAELAHVESRMLSGVRPPGLMFFHQDDEDAWHLAYFFRHVPAAPPEFLADLASAEHHRHRLSPYPRLRYPEMNYLVDAHDGAILFYYSAHPMLDVPSKCRGVDENGAHCEFWGRMAPGGFEMNDPIRNIRTYDLQLQDMDTTPAPTEPVQHPNAQWAATNQAAVSAHVNATRVYDFYKGELKRDSIDDKGMALISVVNCAVPHEEPPPEWANAVWWQNRMWYGQARDGEGNLRSFAQYLDVIAHELTHGVTAATADLVYSRQSGALNESFSDIFGVIIRNWYEAGEESDPRTWNWEIGAGLGADGLPLRDMCDPKRTGDPDHMDDYQDLPIYEDSGGVHSNSNIHNKAAYNLLTATDGAEELAFSAREIAILYYLTLTRLSQLADFGKTLQVLTDVAMTYYAGDEAERDGKIQAIKDAYLGVGIELVND